MIKVAFLGCDSTHTEAFGKGINGADSPWRGKAQVISLWGADLAQASKKAGDLGIPRVARSMEDALEGADLAMVIGRFGDGHYAPATAAIARKIPTFVDKPFTVDLGQAERLIELARTANVPLTSSSPLRFAREVIGIKEKLARADWLSVVVTVPANCTDLGPDPRLQSVFFYGIHGIEILLEVIGHAIANVEVQIRGTVTTTYITTRDKRTAVFQAVRDIPEFYALDAYTKDTADRLTIELDGSYYSGVLDYLLGDFVAGRVRVPPESTRWAISILETIEQAQKAGGSR